MSTHIKRFRAPFVALLVAAAASMAFVAAPADAAFTPQLNELNVTTTASCSYTRVNAIARFRTLRVSGLFAYQYVERDGIGRAVTWTTTQRFNATAPTAFNFPRFVAAPVYGGRWIEVYVWHWEGTWVPFVVDREACVT